MMWARSRSLALVVVSYNWRSSITWVSDKGSRVRGLAIVPFSKDGQHHATPLVYRKYFLEAFSRPALHRGGLYRAGGGLLAASRPTSQRPLGPSGSHQPLEYW